MAKDFTGADPRLHSTTRKLSDSNLATKQKILDAASEIIFSEGHEEMQISKLASDAGISRLTIYRYFPTRECIVSEVVSASMLSWLDELPPGDSFGSTAGERIENITKVMLEIAESNRRMLSAIFACIMSNDPSVKQHQKILVDAQYSILKCVLGDYVDVLEDCGYTRVYSHLIFGSYALLCTENASHEECVEDVIKPIKKLLGPKWNKKLKK